MEQNDKIKALQKENDEKEELMKMVKISKEKATKYENDLGKMEEIVIDLHKDLKRSNNCERNAGAEVKRLRSKEKQSCDKCSSHVTNA